MRYLLGGIVGFVVIVLMVWVSTYNSMVRASNDIDASWSQVQSQLKRRNDLIPNLLATVKGYAKHEVDVFRQVTEARAKVSQVANIDVSKLADDPALQKKLLEASSSLQSSLGRLIAVAESYPDLKASEQFLNFQHELAGTENRIATERGRAIKATQKYNATITVFPNFIFANMAGFKHKYYYEAADSEQATPKVDFQ